MDEREPSYLETYEKSSVPSLRWTTYSATPGGYQPPQYLFNVYGRYVQRVPPPSDLLLGLTSSERRAICEKPHNSEVAEDSFSYIHSSKDDWKLPAGGGWDSDDEEVHLTHAQVARLSKETQGLLRTQQPKAQRSALAALETLSSKAQQRQTPPVQPLFDFTSKQCLVYHPAKDGTPAEVTAASPVEWAKYKHYRVREALPQLGATLWQRPTLKLVSTMSL